MKKLFFVILFFMCTFAIKDIFISQKAVSALDGNQVQLIDESDFVGDKVIVKLSKEASLSTKEYTSEDFSDVGCIDLIDLTSFSTDIVQNKISNNGMINIDNYYRYLLIKLDKCDKDNVVNTINLLTKRDDIDGAMPDYLIDNTSTVPNDSYLSNQWAINFLELPKCWDFTTGHSTIEVGIIDSGIDSSHNDLSGQIVNNLSRNFISDVATTEYYPIDNTGHGTHVSGIIGAIGNNSTGIVGANWNVGLVSLRIFDNNAQAPSSRVALAINYAAQQSIKILNLSSRWVSDSSYSSFESIINSYNGLFVCSAGNDTFNLDSTIQPNHYMPACFSCNNLITVGAIESDGERWAQSNYGLQSVDIYAPGCNIYSTTTNNSYGYNSGTSMATPFVSGVAALLLSINPSLSIQELKNAIINGANSKIIAVPDPSSPLMFGSQLIKSLNAFGSLKYIFSNYVNYQISFSASMNPIYINTEIENGPYFINKNLFYKIDVLNAGYYDLSFHSYYPIMVELFDSNLQLISSYTTDFSNSVINVSPYLSNSTFFIRIRFINNYSEEINISFMNHS